MPCTSLCSSAPRTQPSSHHPLSRLLSRFVYKRSTECPSWTTVDRYRDREACSLPCKRAVARVLIICARSPASSETDAIDKRRLSTPRHDHFGSHTTQGSSGTKRSMPYPHSSVVANIEWPALCGRDVRDNLSGGLKPHTAAEAMGSNGWVAGALAGNAVT
jgi:hypothetical protein